jgi:hypothetical protein
MCLLRKCNFLPIISVLCQWSVCIWNTESHLKERIYSSDQITTWILAMGWGGKLLTEEALRKRDQEFYIRYKKIQSDWSYECTANTVNIFERGITLPGRSEVSQAATAPYWSPFKLLNNIILENRYYRSYKRVFPYIIFNVHWWQQCRLFTGPYCYEWTNYKVRYHTFFRKVIAIHTIQILQM